MPGRWKRVAFLLFVVGWGANHFAALLLVYRRTLALDAAAPAALFGMYALGLVPGLLLSGPLSDRHGRRAIALPAAALAVAASVLLGASGESFRMLLVGRLLYGIGAGAVMNPGAVWLLELSGELASGVGARRATIALSSGFGLGPLVSGLLAQYAPHPTILPYAVHVTAALVALGLCASTPPSPRARVRPGPLLRLGIDRQNRGGFVRGVACMAPFVFAFPAIVVAFLPSALSAALGAAPVAYIGVVAGVTLGAGAIVQPFMRRFAPTSAGRFGLALGSAGCALAAVAVAHQLAQLLLPIGIVLGAAYGICMTAGLRNVEAIARPETRGGLTGLYYVLTYVGFAAPFVLALASGVAPAETSLLVVAELAAIAAVALRAPTRPATPSSSPASAT